MSKPLVTIVCLCYNHALFVEEAMESVFKQTYSHLQIIIIDDGSTDGSPQLLQKIADQHPEVELILLPSNLGNCKAFNIGWRKAKGDFIIDFATDDILLSNKVERQVEFFLTQPAQVGIVFTDASYFNADNKIFKNHFEDLRKRKLLDVVPQGDVFRDVLAYYFIPSPTMMIRREVLELLNGYDENLAYEDFDLWVRASRVYHFVFMNEITTHIRRTGKSMSYDLYKKGNKQLHSTYLICKKAKLLCRDQEDINALRKRLRYEFRHAVLSGNKIEAKLFGELLLETEGKSISYFFLTLLNHMPFSLAGLRSVYQKVFS